MTDTLWDNATRDVDAEVDARRMAAIRVAVAPHFAFLAKAADRADWTNRYALLDDRLTASVERVVGPDLAPTYLTRIARELRGDWHTLRTAHLAPRLAEDAYDYDDSCAVCGHGIDRDPAGEDNRTYHHADGEKHDHEAKPRDGHQWKGAKVAITLRDMDERAYDATCPNKSCENHGTSFVHDDLASDNDHDDETAHCPDCGSPLMFKGDDKGFLVDRKHSSKTAGGLDNLGDNRAKPFGAKDDDEDDDSTTKESKVAYSAPDGTKAKCGTCGKDIESMDYAWYHLAKDFPNGEDHNAHPSPHKASKTATQAEPARGSKDNSNSYDTQQRATCKHCQETIQQDPERGWLHSEHGNYGNKQCMATKTAESHGGYHLEQGDGGWFVVNHIGERKNNEAMSHDKALAYQRALMVNVPGAKEDAERHEKASAKTADGVGPTGPNWDSYEAYQQACKDSGSACISREEFNANQTTAGKKGNPYGNCPQCNSGSYRKDLKACTQCGYKGKTSAAVPDSVRTKVGTCIRCGKQIHWTDGDGWMADDGSSCVNTQSHAPGDSAKTSMRVTSLATLAPGTRLSATSAYLKQAGYPTCAEDCGATLSASDDLINTDSGLAHTSCVLGDAGSRLGFSGGLRATADAGWCECGHKKSAHTDGTGACTEQMGADGTCTCTSFRPIQDLPLESTSAISRCGPTCPYRPLVQSEEDRRYHEQWHREQEKSVTERYPENRFGSVTANWHDAAVSVLTNGPKEVDGMLLDAYTASMLTQVHDALSPANQAKFRAMPLKRAVDTGWALSKKTSAHTPRPGEIRGKCKRCGGGVHVRGGHDESGTYDVWRHDEAAKDLEHSVAPVSEHHQAEPEPRRPMVDWMGNVMAARVGPGPSSDADRCQRCYGKGWIDLGAGMDFTPADNTCPACKGTGIKGGKTSAYYLANSEGEHIEGPFSDREDANAHLSSSTHETLHVVSVGEDDDSEGEHGFGPGSSEFGSDRDRFETVSVLEAIIAANTKTAASCPDCHGSGRESVDHPGMDYSRECGTCGGTGKVPDDNADPYTDNQHLDGKYTSLDDRFARLAAFGDDAWNTPNTNSEPRDDWAAQNGEMAGTIDAIEGKPFNDGGGANGKGEAYARGYKKGFNAAGGRTASVTAASWDNLRRGEGGHHYITEGSGAGHCIYCGRPESEPNPGPCRGDKDDRWRGESGRWKWAESSHEAGAIPAGRETDPTWNDHGACTDCNGSGQVPSTSPFDDPDNSGLQTCPTCGGSGIDPGTGMTGGDRRLANPQRTRVACRKCHAGKDPSGGACDYCDGHGSLDQTLAMVKEADGWSQGITAEAFTTQASPTYQTTALPGLTGKNVTITYTSDRGVDTASGVLSIEGNVAHVGGKSIALHNVLDFKANGYSDTPVGGSDREPSRFDLAGAGIGNGLFPGGAWGMWTGNTTTANMFDRGNNPFSTDGPGAPTNSPAGGADNDMASAGPGNPTTTKPRAKPSSQPNAPAPQMDPMRMTMFPAAQPTVDPNSAAPAPSGDPRSAAKVMQIAEGILATNPGMNDTTALAIAKETVRRFPKVVAARDERGRRIECTNCSHVRHDGSPCAVKGCGCRS